MAQIPTDKEVGMKILEIFGEFHVRPGGMLKSPIIDSKIESYGCRAEDIQRGCKWLLDNGHIELRLIVALLTTPAISGSGLDILQLMATAMVLIM